jgi:superfamily I DNA and RNA helicase
MGEIIKSNITIEILKKEIEKYGLVKGISSMRKPELISLKEKLEKYIKDKDNYNYFYYNINDKNIKINQEQYNVVTEDIYKNIKIIASAGSGKTTTIVCRIKYLIDHGIIPERIMLTTFNVDSAQSMIERIKQIFGFLPCITIGTIDSIACRLWNQYFKSTNFIGISEYTTELLNFLKNSPNKDKVLGKYDYIFFDEFQDCNVVQFSILREFAKNGSKITVIGDDAQNIYQWRGSNIDFILNLDKYIDDVTTHKLINNYRSTPEIISFANISIKYNTDQIPKDMLSNNPSVKFRPTVIQYKDDEMQAIGILKIINEYIEKGLSYDNIAILSRNNYPLKILEEEIVKLCMQNNKNIPYVALITEDCVDTKPKVQEGHLTLCSIHKSKGLEWDLVFLIGTNDKVFPAETDAISLQEERRLFYVAVTRPKKYLYITFTKNTVSRFIAEIPIEYYDFVDFKNEYFQYDNYRNIKFERGVNKLIQMLNENDFQIMREKGIIPDLLPNIIKIHKEHKFNNFIDKYYLHADFGEFIDRFITRNIGKINQLSNGLIDRGAEIVIASVSLARDEYDIYKKYEFNFALNLGLINVNTHPNKYIELISVSNFKFNKITRPIDVKDHTKIIKIISAIIKGCKIYDKDPREILIVPYHYLPNQ